MALSGRIIELKKKHQSLADEVEMAQKNPAIDALELSDLKKKKLHIKEEIARLTR